MEMADEEKYHFCDKYSCFPKTLLTSAVSLKSRLQRNSGKDGYTLVAKVNDTVVNF